MKKKLTLIFISLFLISAISNAQTPQPAKAGTPISGRGNNNQQPKKSSNPFKQNKDSDPNGGAGFFDITLQAGIPLNEFKNNRDDIGFGIGIGGGYQFSKKVPIALGLDFGFMSFGSKNEDKTLTADIKAGNTIIDHLEIPLRFEIQNSDINLHLTLRVYAPVPYVTPFVDGLIGFNYFSTSTKVLDNSPQHFFSKPDNNVIVDKTNLGDFAFSYGAAGGLMIRTRAVGGAMSVYLRAAYLLGSDAEYYTRDDIQNWDIQFTGDAASYSQQNLNGDNVDIHAVPKHSRTDLLFINAGIIFGLL